MTRLPLRRSFVGLAAAAVTLAGIGPAAAAPLWKSAVEETIETTPLSTVAPHLVPELVGVPGSLYEVAASLGIDDTSPTGRGVGIALIDTGLSDVPALQNSNIVIGPDFSFDALDGQELARDRNGHGTHLASLAVGTDRAWLEGDHRRLPGRQIGIAPDAHLVSVKVGAADGAVDASQVIAGINWVIANKDEHNIRVMSLSYGTDSRQPWQVDPLSHAVERAWHAGIFVVVSTGNAGSNAPAMSNPAENPWILAVGAADLVGTGWLDPKNETGVVADFSSGSDGWWSEISMVAPGRSIVGSRLVGAHADQFNTAGRVGSDLVRGTGSSQAAAIVAGLVADLLSARPNLTPDEVKHVLDLTGQQTSSTEEAYRWAQFPNLAGALTSNARFDSPGSSTTQKLERSTGLGSLDAARGTQRIMLGGELISGEVDIFGNDFSDGQWSADSWSGYSWNGYSWNGYSWNGYSWNGLAWDGYSWNGYSWNGYSWNGYSWNGQSWE